MFNKIVQAIKVCGKAKAALEAIDDDVDLDGVREIDQLKDEFEAVIDSGKELYFAVVKLVKTALRLVDHVAKA